MINISVIVPSYKRVDQTIKTIQLILASDGIGSDMTLEVIVADSTPDTSLKDAVLSKFGGKVLYVKPEKVGIAANKNAGAKAAHHPIIIFSDSDIEWEKNTLKEAVFYLKDHPA